MHRGFIKLHRKMLDWEWIGCPDTLSLFIHLLLNANYEDKKWKGIDVKRGQIVAGRASLAEKTGLSQRTVRTSLKKLKATSEVTIKTTNKYSIITITNWELYQSNDQQKANKRPTNDQQTTTPKESKERKESKEYIIGLRPNDVPESLWNDFLKIRKEKKAPMTKTALNMIQKEANKAGMSLNEALQECCNRGWRGFKADWMDNILKQQGKGSGHNGRYTADDALREAIAEVEQENSNNTLYPSMLCIDE